MTVAVNYCDINAVQRELSKVNPAKMMHQGAITNNNNNNNSDE